MATKSAKSLIQNANPDGTVTIFDIQSQSWRNAWLVDARELLANGSCSLNGPEVDMVGPAGEIKVCAEQVEAYTSRGYTLVSDEPTEEPKKVESETQKLPAKNENKSTEIYNFNRHSVVELRQFAAQAGIKDTAELSKGKLIEALDQSGWRPTGS